MSTPGSLSIPSKNTNQSIPAAGPIDGGTLLRFIDPAQGIDADRFALPVGDTTLELQSQFGFSTTTAQRPTWVQVELARILKNGTIDMTGKARHSIIQPGTTTYPDVFTVSEYVNEDDGMFGWTVTHNGSAVIRVQLDIFKAKNPLAQMIHRLGGYNRWSDGTIR